MNKQTRAAVFQPEFIEDLRCWATPDPSRYRRAMQLVEAILEDPFEGQGKPVCLQYLSPGVWSRRLTRDHRIVYLVSDDRVDFLQARYAYEPVLNR